MNESGSGLSLPQFSSARGERGNVNPHHRTPPSLSWRERQNDSDTKQTEHGGNFVASSRRSPGPIMCVCMSVCMDLCMYLCECVYVYDDIMLVNKCVRHVYL